MKFKKLNARGFSHHFVLAFIVMIFGVGGAYYLVASHADSLPCSSGLNPTTINGQCESFIGQASQSSVNETISAYACVTKISSTSWRTTALYRLTNSYSTANGFNWTAAVINNGTTPVPGYQSVYQPFIDGSPPTANVNIYTNPQGQNPLSFSYEAGTPVKGGTTIMGNIAQNIHPDQLVTCSAANTQPSNSYTSAYLDVNPTVSAINFVHGNHNLGVIPQGTTYNPYLLYRVGTTISDKTAIAYKLTNWSFNGSGLSGVSVPNPISIINPTGNLTPNQSTNMVLAMSPDIPNGSYNVTAYLSYEKPATPAAPASWVTGPTLNFSLILSGTPYLDFLSANPLSISETLHRSQVGPSGDVFGQPIILSSSVGTPYQLQESINAPQGVGFYNSGSIPPNGSTAVQTYINPTKYANGQYNGSAIVQYRNDLGKWLSGPTIYYNINLTN